MSFIWPDLRAPRWPTSNLMTKLKLFFASLFLTMAVLLTFIYHNRSPEKIGQIAPEPVRITENIFITSQLKPTDLVDLQFLRIKTIVDMRPDGEAKDQPSSAEVASIAEKVGMVFHYIPVPHESIPETAVEALHQVLKHEAMPAVLYCRTGRRAVRLFALEEATRPGGPDAASIEKIVRSAGFSADDLKDDIARRISLRSDPPSTNP
jgi:uncharacterized protein (TIGR01244 family)